MRAPLGRGVVASTAALLGLMAAGLTGPVRAETPAGAEEGASLVGSYLAGRIAKGQNDTASAARYYRSALLRDPDNEVLIDQAFTMESIEGRWPHAAELAERLTRVQPRHRMAQLVLGVAAFKDGTLNKAEANFRASASGPVGELTGALSLAWVKFAQGDLAEALRALDAPKQADWAQYYLRYHKALIADLAGRRQEARAAYERAFRQDPKAVGNTIAYVRHAAKSGDVKLARSILKEYFDKTQGESNPLLLELRQDIEAGRSVDLHIANPTAGLAEVFYGLGEALSGDGGVSIGVQYLQMALYLQPQHPFALAALAATYEATKRYEDAIAVYDRIPKGTALGPTIEVRKAVNFNWLDRVEEARATLEKLLEPVATTPPPPPAAGQEPPAPAAGVLPEGGPTDDNPIRLGSRGADVERVQTALKGQGYDVGNVDGAFGEATHRAVIEFQRKAGVTADGLVGPKTFAAILGAPAVAPAAVAPATRERGAATLDPGFQLQVLDALGNILRQRKLYAEAITVYDRALSLIRKPDKSHWTYYYARGTSHERVKNWQAAEADLKKALALVPDQPLVLNYLGYSWVDQGINMKEGTALIKRAVDLKPDDGYIVDSLGWAYYRQGNYKQAVSYLERAVELKPDDPVLNDHLGDALWRVGREREARFQWEQALTLNPEPEDAVRIRQKLEQGLTDLPKAESEKRRKEASRSSGGN